MEGAPGPDGAEVDSSDGFYWSAINGQGRLLRFDPDGRIEREVRVPFTYPTMVTFGGPDLRTLFVTSGRWAIARHACSGPSARWRHSRTGSTGAGAAHIAVDGLKWRVGRCISRPMKAHLRQWATALGDTFWLLPGGMVVAGILLGVCLVAVDRSGVVPQWLIESPWLYNGGGTGARTLLGAVASSTIGVAGTVFSITIAALSLAAGQMGPRLLRNFTRDRRQPVHARRFFWERSLTP